MPNTFVTALDDSNNSFSQIPNNNQAGSNSSNSNRSTINSRNSNSGNNLERETAKIHVEELLYSAFSERPRERPTTLATPPARQPLTHTHSNSSSSNNNSSSSSNKTKKMVLPFGLGPDGNNVNDIQTATAAAEYAPSAPPPPYSRGQTNIYTGVPIIPNPYIDFIVVNGSDRYMIRCERKSVLERSVELAKLIHAGPNSGRRGDNHFQVSNVDKHDFELIIRYMETRFIRYEDHKHLLRILELADRFNVPDLIKYCIRELDLNITSASVLDIYCTLWFYQGITLTNAVITTQNKESAKKAHTKPAKPTTKLPSDSKANSAASGDAAGTPAAELAHLIPNPNPFTTEDYGVALLHNALQLIDMHAELVLSKEKMNELRFEELETIVKRDTLQLRSEVTLFECLAEWSLWECRRKQLEATPENRRRVLGPLCVTPRYLRMSTAEFRKCCERIELLHRTEMQLVADTLEGKKLKNLTSQQSELLERFRQPRAEYAKMPVHLSDRSLPSNYPKKMRLASEGRPTDESCWEKAGINCLRVFTCIFD